MSYSKTKKKVVKNNNKVRCILLPLLSYIIGGGRGGNGPISIIYGAHTRNVTKFGFYYCPILFDMTDTDLKDHGEKGFDQ